MQRYSAVVVGAGVEGRAAARALAKRNRRTLLLEQYALSHENGSSHGLSRITRYAYPAEKPIYTNMMQKAMPMWKDLEKESGFGTHALFVPCGLLYVCTKASGAAPAMHRLLQSIGQPTELLTGADVERRYPQLQYGGDKETEWEAVFERAAGVLRADKCMDALLNSFVAAGGVVRDNEPVTGLEPSPVGVAVHTSKGSYHGDSVVLCLGPWAGQFLKRHLGLDLPLEPTLVQALYWRDTSAEGLYSLAGGMPTLIVDGGEGGEHVYGLPAMEHRRLFKLANHQGVALRRAAGSDVDRARKRVSKQTVHDVCVRPVLRHLSKHMLHLDGSKPEIVQDCMYTRTPTWDPYVDVHQIHKNVVVGVGFSGHGFKLAPVMGEILANLADRTAGKNGGPCAEFDLSLFRLPASAARL